MTTTISDRLREKLYARLPGSLKEVEDPDDSDDDSDGETIPLTFGDGKIISVTAGGGGGGNVQISNATMRNPNKYGIVQDTKAQAVSSDQLNQLDTIFKQDSNDDDRDGDDEDEDPEPEITYVECDVCATRIPEGESFESPSFGLKHACEPCVRNFLQAGSWPGNVGKRVDSYTKDDVQAFVDEVYGIFDRVADEHKWRAERHRSFVANENQYDVRSFEAAEDIKVGHAVHYFTEIDEVRPARSIEHSVAGIALADANQGEMVPVAVLGPAENMNDDTVSFDDYQFALGVTKMARHAKRTIETKFADHFE